MGKPLRLSVSLSTLNSENRICTRSSTASVHLHAKMKYDDVKPLFVHQKRSTGRTPMIGKTNLPLTASNTHHYHPHSQNKQSATISTSNKIDESTKKYQSSLYCQQSSSSNHTHLETPSFKDVGYMEPLRSTPRLNDEVCTDEVYLKRHEKYEKQEKSIKRRDRIWQREEQYRLHLMKISTDEGPPSPKLLAIEVVSRMPRGSRRHH